MEDFFATERNGHQLTDNYDKQDKKRDEQKRNCYANTDADEAVVSVC